MNNLKKNLLPLVKEPGIVKIIDKYSDNKTYVVFVRDYRYEFVDVKCYYIFETAIEELLKTIFLL